MTTAFCDRDLPSQCHCILDALFLSLVYWWYLKWPARVNHEYCSQSRTRSGHDERDDVFNDASIMSEKFPFPKKWRKYLFLRVRFRRILLNKQQQCKRVGEGRPYFPFDILCSKLLKCSKFHILPYSNFSYKT